MADEKIYKLSVSRIKDYIRCKRIPAWTHFSEERSPQSPPALKGEKIHAMVETWIKTGQLPDMTTDLGQIAAMAIPHLPERGPHVQAETEFVVPLTERAILRGRMDVYAPPLVGDLKTTGDDRWALDKDSLREDLQALGYAHALREMEGDRYPGYVDLKWVYTMTTARKAWAVDVRISDSEIEHGRGRLKIIADDYVRKFDLVRNPLELPGNFDACGDYGGCYWAKYCHRDRSPWGDDECTSPKGESMSSLADLLAKKKKQAAPTPTPAPKTIQPGGDLLAPLPPAPPPVIVPPEAPPPMQEPPAETKKKTKKTKDLAEVSDTDLLAEIARRMVR